MKTLLSLLLAVSLYASPVWANPSVLEKKIEKSILPHLPQGTRVKIERLSGSPVQGKTAEEVEVLSPFPPVGLVQLQVKSPGKAPRGIQAVVRAYLRVAVSQVAIPHKTHLETQHYQFQEKELSSHARTGYFANAQSMEGLESRGYIRPGVVLNSSNTILSPLIVRGEKAELIDRKGSLALSATVIALEDGKKGQWIKVRNERSQAVLQARVVASRTLSF